MPEVLYIDVYKRQGVWSPDSRYFAMTVSDDRAVKELWVINSLAHPRPTLETYQYQMPGEKEAPIEHLYLFDLVDNKRKEIKVCLLYTSCIIRIQKSVKSIINPIVPNSRQTLSAVSYTHLDVYKRQLQ